MCRSLCGYDGECHGCGVHADVEGTWAGKGECEGHSDGVGEGQGEDEKVKGQVEDETDFEGGGEVESFGECDLQREGDSDGNCDGEGDYEGEGEGEGESHNEDDCEGAGEMFAVSTLDKVNTPLTEDGDIDYSKDFFGKETNLTVSGQLEAEMAALGLGKVYTFGPTFRAENSNTSRHLAEFWMIEPEVAFADLDENMSLAQDMLQYLCSYALDNCKDDIAFLDG